MEVFKRYYTVTDEELRRLVPSGLDTYMDTPKKEELDLFCTTA